MNDIQYAVQQENLKLFADDTSVYIYDKKMDNLINKTKVELTKLQSWFQANKLTLNIEKSTYVIFHAKRKKIDNFANEIKFGDLILKRENSAKYIGIILDEKLNWNEHVQYIKKKTVKFFGIFNNMKYFVSNALARQLYY